jgi:hypothetical protein
VTRLFGALAVVLAAAAAIAPSPAPAVERVFSTGIYPVIQRLVTGATNLLPFALLDPLIVAALALVLYTLTRGVRQAWRARRPLLLLPALGRLLTYGAAGYLAFLVLWGFNYRRVPMTERVVLGDAAPTPDAVVALGLQAVEALNRLHGAAHAGGWSGDETRNLTLKEAFHGVQRTLADAPLAEPGRLKPSILGPYFRGAGVDGMINPFGLEVLANPDLLPFERPFVAAHEWAHLAGYADESEASFVGWLACVRADPPAQYSGWLFLYWQVSGEIGARDRERLGGALAPGPRRDLDAIAERLRRGQWPALRRASWEVYDQYLKANRVDEGVRSYGLVLNLILRTRFADNWTPVRRPATG